MRQLRGQSTRRCAPCSPPRQERIRPQDKAQQDARGWVAGIDVLAHRIKAPVPDVKYPAVSVDLDANAADERSVFVFDDEILIVSEPVGDVDLGTAVMRPAASRRHDRTHDVVTTTPRMADGHQGETAVIGQQLTESLVVVISDDGQ